MEHANQNIARLVRAIAQSLDTGTDKYIIRALEDLEEAGLEGSADFVEACAGLSASRTEVVIGRQEERMPGEFRQLLVPVLLVLQPDHAPPLQLPDHTDDGSRSLLDTCATSLRRYGLIGADPSVLLVPWLYGHDDLPDTWAAQRRMVRQLVEGALGEKWVPLVNPQPTEADHGVFMALRFLVFGVFYAYDDSDRGPLLDPSEAGEEELEGLEDSRWTAWREDLEHSLMEGLPGVRVARIGTPGMWDEAILEGLSMRNISGLISSLSVDGPHQIVSKQVSVGLYEANGGLEFRIGISSDGRFDKGFVWVCHLDPEYEVDEIFTVLQDIGIPESQIYVLDGVQGDERCPDCGEPSFPVLKASVEDGGVQEGDFLHSTHRLH